MQVFTCLAPLVLVAAVLCPGSNGAPFGILEDVVPVKDLPVPVKGLPVPVQGLPVKGLSVDHLPVGKLSGGQLPLGNSPGGPLSLDNLPGGPLSLDNLPGGPLSLDNLPGGPRSLGSLPGGPLLGGPKDLLKKKPQDWVSGNLGGLAPGRFVGTVQGGGRPGQGIDGWDSDGGRRPGRRGPIGQRVVEGIASGASQGYGGDRDEWGRGRPRKDNDEWGNDYRRDGRGGGRPRKDNDEWDNDYRRDGRGGGRPRKDNDEWDNVSRPGGKPGGRPGGRQEASRQYDVDGTGASRGYSYSSKY